MKVYISSTYRDLREHRAAVALALRRMGHDVIGMEEYVAEGMTPLKRCLDDVRRADAYVVIVGWRYGYVPVDTILNPDKRSITELELGAARDAGRPALAFLVDPDAPWPPSAIDALSEAGGAEIRRLRADVGSEYLVGTFSTPDSLASQVIAAVAAQGANRHLGERALNQAAVSDSMAAFVRGGSLSSTKASIVEMVVKSGVTRSLELHMAPNDVWWSTRLYLLAGLTQELTCIRQFVFTYDDGTFAGMVSPASVRVGLSAAFPAIHAFDDEVRTGEASQDVDRETNRWTALWDTRISPTEPAIKVDLRWSLLADWFGDRLITRSIDVDPEIGLTMVQIQQLVDFPLADVPVQRRRKIGSEPPDGKPEIEVMVIDRDAFALELAREWVRTGLPRMPFR